MPKVIGVRFRTSTRMYYFAPTEGEEYPKNSHVVVETQRGVELATVVLPVTEVEESKLVAPLKPVLRKATEADIQAVTADADKKQEILSVAKQKAAARGLDMKIVDCEYTVDHSKLVLYFTAEQRVDFRELVRDLASAFHNRIDLRQIGARDECKLIGSLGTCGMPCCCGRFESDCEHVSIKMAKNQSLALTPNKINGMCGRLLCCLGYENKTYEDVLKRAPKHNAVVTCPDGRRGTVVSVTPLTEKVRVRVGDNENFEFCEYTLAELNGEAPVEDRETEKRSDAEALSDYDYIPEPPPERERDRHGRNKHNGDNNENNGNNNSGGSKNKNKRNRNRNKSRGDNNNQADVGSGKVEKGGKNNNKKPQKNNNGNNNAGGEQNVGAHNNGNNAGGGGNKNRRNNRRNKRGHGNNAGGNQNENNNTGNTGE